MLVAAAATENWVSTSLLASSSYPSAGARNPSAEGRRRDAEVRGERSERVVSLGRIRDPHDRTVATTNSARDEHSRVDEPELAVEPRPARLHLAPARLVVDAPLAAR